MPAVFNMSTQAKDDPHEIILRIARALARQAAQEDDAAVEAQRQTERKRAAGEYVADDEAPVVAGKKGRRLPRGAK